MAVCPICNSVLPETELTSCPNCGASVLHAPQAEPEPPAEVGSPADATVPPADAAVPPPPPLPGPPSLPGAPPPRAGSVPWEERDRLGLLTALVDTTRLVLTAPSTFFRSMPVTGGLGSPLLYAVIVGWVGVVVASFYQAVFRSLVGPGIAGFGDRPELTAMVGWMQSWAGFLAQVVFGGVLVAIGVFIWTAILHVMLLLLGGARRDFEATLRVVSFSQATSLFLLLPFCGSLIAFAWSLVLYVIGLAEAHQIPHGKAAAAVLLPLLLCCCCCVALVAMGAFGIAGLAGLAGQGR